MFEILRANAGGYFWRLKGANGETLCHSEVYTSKQSAQTASMRQRGLLPSPRSTTVPNAYSASTTSLAALVARFDFGYPDAAAAHFRLIARVRVLDRISSSFPT
jgi:hypothetical protein